MNTVPGGVYVALLRGINVGGRNMLPMKDLVAMFDTAGCGEARTYIQSGNVIFRARPTLALRLPSLIAKAIADRFGFRVPLVVRTVRELRIVVKGNPFLTGTASAPGREAGANIAILHVAFLADLPSAADVAALDPNQSPPDQFTVRGREVYLRCPGGFGRTKLTNQYFDSKLRTTSTVRNWRTVLELLKLAGG